jgi:TRAP-type C4-dicarboxylate transport system permease small subunit
MHETGICMGGKDLTIADRLVGWAMKICFGLSALAMALIAILVSSNSFIRYAFNKPLAFTDEFVGLLMIAMLFLSLPVVLYRGRHIRMTLLTQRLGGRTGAIVAVVAAAILVAFAAWFMREALESFGFEYRFQTRTSVAEILLYPWIAILPFSMAMIVLVSLVLLPSWVRRGRLRIPEDADQ